MVHRKSKETDEEEIRIKKEVVRRAEKRESSNCNKKVNLLKNVKKLSLIIFSFFFINKITS